MTNIAYIGRELMQDFHAYGIDIDKLKTEFERRFHEPIIISITDYPTNQNDDTIKISGKFEKNKISYKFTKIERSK
jgi:hypothetical protein